MRVLYNKLRFFLLDQLTALWEDIDGLAEFKKLPGGKQWLVSG